MAKEKSPAVLFYTSDFLTGTRLMTYEEIGKYITLLCLQHQHGHLSEEDMLSICGAYTPHIYTHFEVDSDGKYFNNRMEIEGIKRSNYLESRRKNRSSKTYVEHMENENVNENINIFINNNNYTNKLKEIIISWLNYKIERNENYKEQGFKSLLTQIKNNVDKFSEERVIEVVNSSMSSNYKGIIWDKLKEQRSWQNEKIRQQEEASRKFLEE